MYTTAIIVAGGRGVRLCDSTPKQFLEIGGVPILMRTIEAFKGLVDEIIVVLPSEFIEHWDALCQRHTFRVKHKVTVGDSERFSSVRRGLECVSGSTELVLVHDGVRPFVDSGLISRVIEAAVQNGAAAPAVPVTDTLRWISGGVLSRSQVMAMQTPQAFRYDILVKSYRQEFSSAFTDDVSVVEAAGYGVEFVEGDVSNFKITTPYDLRLAQLLVVSG